MVSAGVAIKTNPGSEAGGIICRTKMNLRTLPKPWVRHIPITPRKPEYDRDNKRRHSLPNRKGYRLRSRAVVLLLMTVYLANWR